MAASAPWLILGYLFTVLMCLIWAADFRTYRWYKPFVLTVQWRPWAAKIWKYSTTIGRGIVFQSSVVSSRPFSTPQTRIERHEFVHVRQCEDLSLAGFILAIPSWALTGSFLWACIVWTGFLPLCYGVACLTAWLRGWHFYRDNEMELSAYSQTDLFGTGHSWQHYREKHRKEML